MSGDQEAQAEMPHGVARWLAAQEHLGENTGDSETHVIFVELKEPSPDGGASAESGPLGPSEA